MKIRDHPLVCYRGLRSWPPVWMWTGTGANRYPRGELGALTEVHVSIAAPGEVASAASYNRVYLFMKYRDSRDVGCLLFDDAASCRQIGEILSQNCGKTVKEIGDIDLAHFL